MSCLDETLGRITLRANLLFRTPLRMLHPQLLPAAEPCHNSSPWMWQCSASQYRKRKNNLQCLYWKGNCIWILQTLLGTLLLPCFLQCFWKWFWYCLVSICFQDGFTKIPVSLSINTWRNHRHFSNLRCTFTRVVPEVFSGKWNMTNKVWLAGYRWERQKGLKYGFAFESSVRELQNAAWWPLGYAFVLSLITYDPFLSKLFYSLCRKE